MPRLQPKAFIGPDDVRRFPNGLVEIVTLDEIAVSRFVFQPGRRWKEDVGRSRAWTRASIATSATPSPSGSRRARTSVR